jgi:hypothetical protein
LPYAIVPIAAGSILVGRQTLVKQSISEPSAVVQAGQVVELPGL